MKRQSQKIKKELADDLTFSEKVTSIYLGAYIAKETLLTTVETAFIEKKISAKDKKGWRHLFLTQYNSCMQMEMLSYRDIALLEFKVRHLMDAAMNISFDRKEPWQGFTVPFENTLFPVFSKKS